MKNLLTLILMLFCLQLFAQEQQQYSQISVLLDGEKTIADLAALGVEVDHGDYEPGKYLRNYFSKEEIKKIEAAGFEYKIMVADWDAHWQKILDGSVKSRVAECVPTSKIRNYKVPDNFIQDTDYAGYYSYQQMLDILDDMAAKYPDLITQKAPVGDLETHEGHPIHWLRMSKNASVDENEPEILYTALHHAREPMSLKQLIFFMWYMLENYGDDPEVTFLLDNTELYFMPCLNPDGYLYNEQTNGDGGGFWRKNRRDNGDGTHGIDLNRNYGFSWAFDDIGSSPSTDSDTYRGTEEFSEPETQAVKEMCEKHDFVVTLNYHSHGNLLIYPWGYLDTPTDDSTTFRSIADAMTLQNDYKEGTGTETVGYTVNGDSDDWMYGERGIYAMTPEVGSAFWTDTDEQLDNARSNVWSNLVAANIPHQYGFALDKSEPGITSTDGFLQYEVTRAGLASGDLRVTLSPISPEILMVGDSKFYTLELNEKVLDSISFNLASDVEDGDELLFELTVASASIAWTDTLRKSFSLGLPPVLVDDGSTFDKWGTVDDWGVDTEHFRSAPSSIADTPNDDYGRNEDNYMKLREPLDLSTALDAKLNFWAKWDIEKSFDYVQIMASTDDRSYTPLCGRYTVFGTDNQDEDEPLWDGVQEDWVEEEVSLSDYIGNSAVFLQFRLISDRFAHGDGFNFDDFAVQIKMPGSTFVENLEAKDFMQLSVRPNPSSENFLLEIIDNHPISKDGTISVFNAVGQQITSFDFNDLKNNHHLTISTEGWQSGVYYLKINSPTHRTDLKKLVLMK